jgi:hypothetical protein
VFYILGVLLLDLAVLYGNDLLIWINRSKDRGIGITLGYCDEARRYRGFTRYYDRGHFDIRGQCGEHW